MGDTFHVLEDLPFETVVLSVYRWRQLPLGERHFLRGCDDERIRDERDRRGGVCEHRRGRIQGPGPLEPHADQGSIPKVYSSLVLQRLSRFEPSFHVFTNVMYDTTSAGSPARIVPEHP